MKYGHIFILITVNFISSVNAKTIYINATATGNNNGSSWKDAYSKLQTGLDAADPNDQIWVAEGTYIPTSDHGRDIGDRGRHFRMKNNVKIYGGFSASGNPKWEARDWNKYKTFLSGDLSGNDPELSDNCYHVFYHPDEMLLNKSALLDGFIITGGYSRGTRGQGTGGGMCNNSCNPTITHCTFTNNKATSGAGIFNFNSNPIVTQCVFINNSGSGIYNGNNAKPVITSCVFEKNSGSGVYNHYSNGPIITDCIFDSNSAKVYGGGMYSLGDSPVVKNCTFVSNTAFMGGGGIYCWDKSSPKVINCIFNCNSAKYGGGIYSTNGSNITIVNCTFTSNVAEHFGGGLYNCFSSNSNLANCIFWGNKASIKGNEIHNQFSTSLIRYSNVAGSNGSGDSWDKSLGVDKGGNIDTAPLFVDKNGPDNIVGNKDDNLHLLAHSPCIDAGDPSEDYTDQIDIDGDPRLQNNQIDIGVDEVSEPPTPSVSLCPSNDSPWHIHPIEFFPVETQST